MFNYNFGDLSGFNEDWDDGRRKLEKKQMVEQSRVLELIGKGEVDLSGSLRFYLMIHVSILKQLYPTLIERYQYLQKDVPPINRYIRDLILRDSGVDIDSLNRMAVDPLCRPGVVEELIELNPMMWDDRQQMWLRNRAMGLSLSQMQEISKRDFPEERGPSLAAISQFLNGVREKAFGVKMSRSHTSNRKLAESKSCSKPESTTPRGRKKRDKTRLAVHVVETAPEKKEGPDSGCEPTPPGVN